MPLKTQFQIVESETEITEPVTKFGGQPVWISQPYWPLCPETGDKMLFMSQIALDPKLFPDGDGTMVYIFFSGDSEMINEVDIATVIQTSANAYLDEDNFEYVPETTGSTIYELDENCQAIYKEYKAVLEPIEDEEIISIEEMYRIYELDYDMGFQFSKPELAGNKIGGQPLYMKSLTNVAEGFNSEKWLLLLQLASTQGYWDNLQPNFYPFHMELGEFGILTVFISSDYKRTKCYVQQP